MSRPTQVSSDSRPLRVQGCNLLRPKFPLRSAEVARAVGEDPTTPRPGDGVWAVPRSLAATGGISVDFFSCGYLDGSVPRVRLPDLCIRPEMTEHDLRRVPPFGHPGVKNCLRLVRAYRS